MKAWKSMIWVVVVLPLMAGANSFAQEQDLGTSTDGPWLFSTRAGAQFSDNRDGLEEGDESNVDFYIEPRLDYTFRDGERTTLGLALLPQVKWHSNPREDDVSDAQNEAELFGSASVELSHQLNPRLLLSIGDAITYSDDPEVNNGGATVRYSNSHILNNFHAGMDYAMTEKLTSGVRGKYILRRYTDSKVAESGDEDIVEGDVNMKYLMGSGYRLLGVLGASKFENGDADFNRGSSVLSVGAGVEKTFTPDLIGKVMAGYQHGEYEDDSVDAIDTPNGSVELTMRAASETRFRIGAGYGLYAPYVRPYSIQTLTTVNAGIDHDVLSKRLTVSLDGQYGNGQYDEERDLEGGDDTMTMASLRANYRIDRTWSVNAGYTYENWDSDVREPFTRNLVDIGVQIKL